MKRGQASAMRVRVLPLLAVLGATLALGASAAAQEVITAGPKGAPPAAAPDGAVSEEGNSPEAIGAWGRRVLAGEPAPDDRRAANGKASGCPAPPDHRPHGAVWAGIGTGGYREVGGAVTQPLGDCGQVSVAIDKVEGRFGARR